MPLPADYHMHTPLCRHAVGEPVEYAAQAVKVGLTEIGFTDHSPMRRDDFDNWRMRADQLDEYVEKVRRAEREFPQLTIKLALEVDYLPGHEEWIRELAARHPWDYFIGSVHYVSDRKPPLTPSLSPSEGERVQATGEWDVDNPAKISEWKHRDAYEVWSVYFERLTMAAESGLFEIIGHADLPKKFRFYPDRDCTPLFDRFLCAAASKGVAVELNTAGLRKDCKEIYPSRQILQMAFERGVPITFGSDAHAPGEVGMDFASAIELARSVGYRECCGFTQRKRTGAAF
ncbi:MAG: histidinol-phosphatase HisJ family protein [Verrucomicrobia bacterium]|nr:histidinol-phosphatase HisJ family protein [Verrucomicrobiota bacterium]